MNCWGSPFAGMPLATASTAPPPRRRRFTMAAPIPLLPPVTRIRLPVNSLPSHGTLDSPIVCNSRSKIVCDNPIAQPDVGYGPYHLLCVQVVRETEFNPAGLIKRL